jgi:hypothetical protein
LPQQGVQIWVDAFARFQYWKARWVTLEAPDVSIDGTSITTRIKVDVRDESAPAGGMLYNIERRSAAGGVK